ncbi:MAG TPA: 50S ribosomal protein L10 [Chloroflexota bacterium]
MPNRRNVDAVKSLEEKFRQTQTVFITDYRGLKVSDLANLRRQLRELGVDYFVAKNTLAQIAAESVGLKGLEPLLKGPTAIAFVHGEPGPVARTLSEFARISRILTLKGGVLGPQVLNAEELGQVAALAPRAQLRADLVGSVQGPLAALIGVLNGALSGVVHALEERQKQLAPAGSAPASLD